MTPNDPPSNGQLTITACCGLTLTRPISDWINPIVRCFQPDRPSVRLTTFEMLRHEPPTTEEDTALSVLLVIFPETESIHELYRVAEHARKTGRPALFLCETLDPKKVAVSDEGLLVEQWDLPPEQVGSILRTLSRRQPTVTRLSRELDMAEQLLNKDLVPPHDQNELDLAGLIPFEIMPARAPEVVGLDLTIAHRAACGIPRDLIQISMIDEDVVRIFAADAIVEGTAGALLAARLAKLVEQIGGLDNISRRFYPGQAMAELNDELAQADLGTPGRRAAAFYGVLDVRTGELTFSIAGYPLPAIIRNGEIERVGTQTSPLGSRLGTDFPELTVTLEDGDNLAIVSDGAEGITLKDPAFSLPGLFKRTLAAPFSSMDDVRARLIERFDSVPGSLHRDNDCTVLALRLAARSLTSRSQKRAS